MFCVGTSKMLRQSSEACVPYVITMRVPCMYRLLAPKVKVLEAMPNRLAPPVSSQLHERSVVCLPPLQLLDLGRCSSWKLSLGVGDELPSTTQMSWRGCVVRMRGKHEL